MVKIAIQYFPFSKKKSIFINDFCIFIDTIV